MPSPGVSRSQRHAFVGGLHRSGTTLVARLLAEHPDISAFSETGAVMDEGQFLQDVFPLAMRYGGPGRFGFAPGAHLTEESDLVTAENRKRLLTSWRRHWDLERTVLLEKSPPNLLRTRFLQAMVPDARFIMVVRHPLAVSYATRKWSRTGLGSLLEHWLRCHEILSDDLPQLREVRVVHYERFVEDPAGTIRGMFEFLGLPAHPVAHDRVEDVNERYFARWRRQRGLRVWGALRRRRLVRRFEERVNRFGYSLVDLEARGPDGELGSEPWV